MEQRLRFKPGLSAVCLAIAALSACGGGSGIDSGGVLHLPAITAQSSAVLQTPGGVLGGALSLADPASGAAVAIPAGTSVGTTDPRYDTNGDGSAETFAVSIQALPAAAAECSLGRRSSGGVIETLELIGGAQYAPPDTELGQPAALRIPLGAQLPAGTALEVWRYGDAHAASQAGADYWRYAGHGIVELAGGKAVARYTASLLGSYALTLPATPNHAPSITWITADPYSILPGGSSSLTCVASDLDGDALTYSWSGPGVFSTPALSITNWSHEPTGTYSIQCSVSDELGATAARTISLHVISSNPPNMPPVIVAVSAVPQQAAPGESVTLSCTAGDPDGDTLLYSWSGGGTFTDPGAAVTSWSIGVTGAFTLSCSVDDGRGGLDSKSVDVIVVVPPDTQPPQFAGGDPALTAAVREHTCALTFTEAADPSGVTAYNVYAGETAGFDLATATHYVLNAYPVQPYVVPGLTPGTAYTFALTAQDGATPPNVTGAYYVTATPQPYYDDVPAGGHALGQTATCADIALKPGTARGLVLAWANDAGMLMTARVPDAHASANPDLNWLVETVDTGGVTIPQVFFRNSLPVIAACDNAGAVFIYEQQADGTWTRTRIFNRPGAMHVALSASYDEAADQLYIAHATEAAGPPRVQSVHFLVADLAAVPPAVADSIEDIETADYIAQVCARQDQSGQPWLIYSAGQASLVFPPVFSMELVFSAYTPGGGLSSQRDSTFNPMFFDVAPDPAGWKLLVTDAEAVTIGSYTIYGNLLKLAAGTPGNWGTPQTLYTGTVDSVGGVATYDYPFECVLGPADRLYFTRGAGTMDSRNMLSTAALSTWSVQGALPPVQEAGKALSRLKPLAAPGGDFLLGEEISSFEVQSITDQLDLPGGYLVLREIP